MTETTATKSEWRCHTDKMFVANTLDKDEARNCADALGHVYHKLNGSEQVEWEVSEEVSHGVTMYSIRIEYASRRNRDDYAKMSTRHDHWRVLAATADAWRMGYDAASE